MVSHSCNTGCQKRPRKCESVLLYAALPPQTDWEYPGGQTALMIAVSFGEDRVVEILLANNADMTVRDNKGQTAMDYAVKDGDLDDIVGMLEQEEARRRGVVAY